MEGLGVGSKARRSRPARRVVTCDGVPGVLVKGEDGWALANEPEVKMLAAMGGSDRALGLLRVLVKTLNAGLIDPSRLALLNKRLAAVAAVDDEDDLCRMRMPDEVLQAAAFVCAHMDDPNSSQWLAWMLSARLGDNLLQNVLVGPGLLTFQYLNSKYDHGFDRDARWADEMPSSFWDLSAASDAHIRGQVAGNPSAPACVLKALAQDTSERARFGLAGNPSAPVDVLRDLATNDYFGVRADVAGNPSVPAD